MTSKLAEAEENLESAQQLLETTQSVYEQALSPFHEHHNLPMLRRLEAAVIYAEENLAEAKLRVWLATT